ncbi:MAG TPA: ATP synthase F1 subunit epsilon [Candidatus Saccharimonadia bacterium]|jgi:F-type H+-transporting ATPase subunit epsilon|nr:ATP synthase F1 subunit epsilon [Candidatus Saccharimonadia bacterium]
MRFELLTLAGVKYAGDVTQVSLTTVDGEIGILPHHERLTAIAAPGPVTVRVGAKKEVFATFGGLLEVTAERVRLLSDEADHLDDLIESEIEAAIELAQALKSAAKDKRELSHAQQMIDRQAVRLNVARMRRHGRPDQTPVASDDQHAPR